MGARDLRSLTAPSPSLIRHRFGAVGALTACLGFIVLGGALALALLQYQRARGRPSRNDASAMVLRRGPLLLRASSPFIALLSVWMVLLLVVHTHSRDDFYGRFPAACPAGKGDPGCSRIALSHASASRGMSCYAQQHRQQPLTRRVAGDGAPPVPQLQASRYEVHRAIADWIGTQPRTAVLESDRSANFTHARFASFFWGFADDLYVRLSCHSQRTAVELQGNLRMGHGDMGVNAKRNRALIAHLHDLVASGELKPGIC